MKTRLITFIALVTCPIALSPLMAEEGTPKPEGAKTPAAPAGPAASAERGGKGGKGGPGSFFQSLDKNGDKLISKEEAGEHWERLQRLDKNNDGMISMEELAAAREGRRPDGASREGRPEGAGREGRPEGAGREGRSGQRGQFFENADKNQDGKLSKDEVSAEVWERISKYDTDGDGAVSREEMAAAMREGQGRRGGKGSAGAGQGGPRGGGVEGIFSRYDTDQDGKLSKSEVPAEMWERLSRADENADGLVSKEELEKVYRDRRGDSSGQPQRKGPRGEGDSK